MKRKHIQAYLKTTLNFAECSTAKRLHVGAICVKDDKIISIGYNGTPQGWDNCCEDAEGKTLPEVCHAESNCLMKLARHNGGAGGAVMFCTHSPCIECAKLIYAAGITTVYYITQYRSLDGVEFLNKAGVQVIHATVE
jgi:dCMP deaminase